MKKAQQGFTLIELMIVVAIIGILAAIAIPAYQDYITRSKVTELVTAADACKTSVSEYYQATNAFPPDLATSGCATVATQYIASIDVTANTGVITVAAKTGANALPAAAAGNLVLTPTVNASNASVIDWTCVTGTSIPKKFLPATCR